MGNISKKMKFRIVNKLIIDKNKLSVILESEEKDSNIRKINLNSILTDKMERESDLYNEGLSKMIKLEKQIGTSKITEYVRTHNRLPKN